jgi:hypothetical protein
VPEEEKLFRDRRQDRREERRGGTGAMHYRMRQKLVSIGDDYWIENDQGERVFKVDGKALRVRQTLIFEDSHGRELLKIQERVARVRDTMEIEDPGGHTVATVKKALITPLRDRWTVKVADGPGPGRQGQHRGPRVHRRGRPVHGGRGVQEVVPDR